MDFFIPAAMAQTQSAPPQQPQWLFYIMMFGIVIFMYFIMIRPQQKRQKEHRDLVSSLGKGDEVLLNSGLMGKITKVDENYVVLEVANNIELKFQKIAVHAVLPKGTINSI